MSCSCGNPSNCRCGCDPCSTPAAADAQNETLSSALDNFIYNFYGTITKTVVDGEVVWTLPCDLATGIPGYPRDPNDGTACYFKNLFVDLAAATADAEAASVAAVAAVAAVQAQIDGFGNIVTQNKEAINIAGGTISGASVKALPIPTGANDAATKAYVDALITGIFPQPAVAAATAVGQNINIAATPHLGIDGIPFMSVGDRVLLKNQLIPAQNGIYLWGVEGAPMTRAPDADTPLELSLNRYYAVQLGGTNMGSAWIITSSPGTIGVDPVVFSQFTGASAYSAGTGIQLIGSQFSIDPAVVLQRPNNLSDVANPATARTNLGLGTISTTLVKAAYGAFISPIAAYSSPSGGVYFGFGAGAGIIRSVLDNSGAPAPLSLQIGNGTQIGLLTSAGLELDGVLSFGSPANAAATKVNLGIHLGINIRDYGAVGNGVTNDTAAINAAIAALTSYSSLYIPAGRYLITPGGLTAFTGLTDVTVYGDGRASVLYSSTTGAPSGFLVFAASCDRLTIRDFSLIGSATVRGSGGHGLIMYASHTLISGIYISGTSDFGMYISNGAGGYTREVQVVNCISDHTFGDGFHFGAVTDSGIYNCLSYYTADDGLGIGDDGGIGFPPLRIEVVGFQSIQAGNFAAYGGASHGAGIRIFDGAQDIHITGGSVTQAAEAGLTCGRFFGTTSYNTRIVVNGLKAYQCIKNSGMYGQINFQFCNKLTVQGCHSEAPTLQGCYAFLDCNDIVVSGNTAKDAVLRAFLTDDGTTANVAAVWSNWSFLGNTVLGGPSDASFYFIPATGKSIANLVLAGNTDIGGTYASYIVTNRLATAAKIMNNISLTGKAIINGGIGISPTTANNN